MSTPEPKFIIVTKRMAALAQLESAIWLWFTRNDPVAIRGLAEAAHDCYHSMCKHKGFPSILADIMKAQSKGFQARQARVRSFLKHGWKNLTGKERIYFFIADSQLFECVCCHIELFNEYTPLLNLFYSRFLLENPAVLPPEDAHRFHGQLSRDQFGEIEVAKMSRADFLNEFLPFAQKLCADLAARST